MVTEGSLILRYRGGRFIYLLLSLLLLLIVSPLVERWQLGVVIFNLFLSLTLLASIFTITHHRTLLTVGSILALGTFISNWLPSIYELHTLGLIGALLGVFYFGFTSGVILGHLLTSRQITVNEIAAAISTYLLLGLTGAFIFAFLEYLDPAAIITMEGVAAVIDGNQALTRANFNEYIYFSFTSLTTLGYGDLIPATPLARVFAFLEAVIGQIFLAVLVARLVGMHISQGP